jgi:hypothetical protein
MSDSPPGPLPIGRPLRECLLAERAGLLAYVERKLPAVLRGTVDPIDVVQDVCCEALRYESSFRPEQDPTGRR